MKNLQNKIEILEKSIKKLEKRNKKVEADKSWETSTFRKISVAPSYPNLAEELVEVLGDSFDVLEKYYNTEINFEKVNKLNNEFVVFLSDNDPYINMENAKKYYGDLENIKFVDFKGKGHFNESAGILELEEVLEYL